MRKWQAWSKPATTPAEAKDFHKADALRKELQSMGVHLTDGPSGTTLEKERLTEYNNSAR